MKRKFRKTNQVLVAEPTFSLQKKALEEKERDLKEKEKRISDRERLVDTDRKVLEDTLHEIRKINNQIKGNILELEKLIDGHIEEDGYSERHIKNALKTIDGNSSLLSIRMDAYDILYNPASINTELDLMIGVYSKIEKVYKCLYSSKKEKNLDIILKGGSEKKFRLRNSIELAFFIIIENAIKYSPEDDEITISFQETDSDLRVQFQNWGICPALEEMPLLTHRGFRSSSVSDNTNYSGSGLGLYLLDQICHTNHVDYTINVDESYKYYKGLKYNPFVVSLQFKD